MSEQRPTSFELVSYFWKHDNADLSIGERIVLCGLCIGVGITPRSLLASLSKRVALTELYHFGSLAVLLVISLWPGFFNKWLVYFFLVFVSYELLAWAVFDVFVESKMDVLRGRRSAIRSFAYAVYSYLIVTWCYAIYYLFSCSIVANKVPLGSIGSAFYFSLTTITTLGYGDYSPDLADVFAQIVVVSEPVFGLILILVYVPTIFRELSVQPNFIYVRSESVSDDSDQ